MVETTVGRGIHVARSEAEVRRCWPAFHELRPHLRSEDELVERWRRQVPEGYRIIYVLEGEAVSAAAGYRDLHTMAWGHILYIDDLAAVRAFQGKGLGTLLLQYMQEEARRMGCDAIHLDTGYQRHLAQFLGKPQMERERMKGKTLMAYLVFFICLGVILTPEINSYTRNFVTVVAFASLYTAYSSH